eukprot:3177369-Ditylum_brightwellii.AAC.1
MDNNNVRNGDVVVQYTSSCVPHTGNKTAEENSGLDEKYVSISSVHLKVQHSIAYNIQFTTYSQYTTAQLEHCNVLHLQI